MTYSGITVLQGVEFSIFLLILEWDFNMHTHSTDRHPTWYDYTGIPTQVPNFIEFGSVKNSLQRVKYNLSATFVSFLFAEQKLVNGSGPKGPKRAKTGFCGFDSRLHPLGVLAPQTTQKCAAIGISQTNRRLNCNNSKTTKRTNVKF